MALELLRELQEDARLRKCTWARCYCRNCDGQWQIAFVPDAEPARQCPRCGREDGVFVVALASGLTARPLPDSSRSKLLVERPQVVRQRGVHWS